MAIDHGEEPVPASASPPRSESTSESPAGPPDAQKVRRVGQLSEGVLDEVSKVIVGKRHVLELVMAAILSEGAHVLLEDMPGVAKSVMASTFSKALGCDFKRVQFTPDLLPADITGTFVFNQAQEEFSFHPGPIFSNFLLADEINRASPKTQSALLEAMAEKQVSVEGTTHKLQAPFMVIATQNPVEQEGTYPLPEAQMDRFMMKLSMGYPAEHEETEIINRRLNRGKDDFDVQPITNQTVVVRMQQAMELVHVSQPIVQYISKIVSETRSHPHLEAGASPRGSLAILKIARSWAALNARPYVSPDDIKQLAAPCLAHRVILAPEARIDGVTGVDVIERIVEETPAPKASDYGAAPGGNS